MEARLAPGPNGCHKITTNRAASNNSDLLSLGLEARSPESRCQQGWLPLETLREGLSSSWWPQALPAPLWQARHPASDFSFTGCPPAGLSKFHLLSRIGHCIWGPPTPGGPSLPLITAAKTLFPSKVTLTGSGVRTSTNISR